MRGIDAHACIANGDTKMLVALPFYKDFDLTSLRIPNGIGQQIIEHLGLVDKLMLANMTLLETEKALALTNPEFLHNQTLRQYAIYVQVAVTVFILCISVFRPWKKKKQAVAA
ncbi:hypothetical protein [Paenibacillus sp. Soil750]|uniref:hypothetical protein n=1 Tax=Paenibacillus sp. Soil750 TaxID=1736398 RepID=UPI000712E447|nr:hypothetical protein [Paenibacillus sp. Soil750]KRE73847.1 hypothetical protein ASL11_05890 [Paenibacillus sp. Soil750]